MTATGGFALATRITGPHGIIELRGRVRTIPRTPGTQERPNIHQTVQDALTLPSPDRARPEGHR
jgi:hypothetical protein